MRRGFIGPIVWGGLGGGCLILFIGGWMWNPVATVFRAAHQAEVERLRDAFEQPLAAARAKGDDLAEIDELRRLRSVPGVLSANMTSKLTIKLSTARWRRLREQWLERLGALTALAIVLGGVAGGILIRRQRRHFLRLHTLLTRRRGRRRELRRRVQMQMESRIMPWVHQALSFGNGGLVLLDKHQRTVAFNREAAERYGLSREILGRHWLDIQPVPEWALALQQSIQKPGERLPGPPGASIITPSLEATWIVCM